VLVPTFDVAPVVVALTVAVLGLGLRFEVEVHPATSSGAATRTTAIKSKYFFTFHPFILHIGGYEAKGECFKLSFCRLFVGNNALTELNTRSLRSRGAKQLVGATRKNRLDKLKMLTQV
jgi:hypothetical protein